MITLIVAVNKKGIIAKDGKIPWKNPHDLAFFKQETLFKPVLMGRKTFETLMKPLSDRQNIVLTNNKNYKADDSVVIVHEIGSLIQQFQHHQQELMVAGGAQLYYLMMPYASKLIVSIINDESDGDVSFPFIHPARFICTEIRKQDDFEVAIYHNR